MPAGVFPAGFDVINTNIAIAAIHLVSSLTTSGVICQGIRKCLAA
jgi:hypothetical protein